MLQRIRWNWQLYQASWAVRWKRRECRARQGSFMPTFRVRLLQPSFHSMFSRPSLPLLHLCLKFLNVHSLPGEVLHHLRDKDQRENRRENTTAREITRQANNWQPVPHTAPARAPDSPSCKTQATPTCTPRTTPGTRRSTLGAWHSPRASDRGWFYVMVVLAENNHWLFVLQDEKLNDFTENYLFFLRFNPLFCSRSRRVESNSLLINGSSCT